MNKYINADKLKERVKDLKFSTEGIKTVLDLIDELSEEREDKFKTSPIHNKIAILEMMDKLDPSQMVKVVDLLRELEQQPNPLKIAIKGDGTEEYGKKIIEYFKEHDIKNRFNHKCNNLFYYYGSEDENITFDCNLLEGYTEISLKEEWKEIDSEVLEVLNSFSKASGIKHSTKNKGISHSDSVLNAYIIALEHKSKRVEELEKELIDLKLKLKDLSK